MMSWAKDNQEHQDKQHIEFDMPVEDKVRQNYSYAVDNLKKSEGTWLMADQPNEEAHSFTKQSI